MTSNLKLNIIKTIKKEQLKIINILEDDYATHNSVIDYEDELNQVDDNTRKLIKLVEEKSQYFTRVVNSEDELLNLFDKFFDEINQLIEKLISHYKLLKKTIPSEIEIIVHNTSLLIVKNILNDYMNFLVKLEGAILGLYSENVILKIDAKEQIGIIQYFQENKNQSIFMPLLLSFGIGYLIGDM